MTVIRRQDDGTSRRVCLIQDCRQKPYRIDSPRQLHLLGLGEVIVHSIQNNADYALPLVA